MLYRGGGTVIKLANSPSNFVHETQLTKPPAHTLRFRCDPAPWLPPLSPSHGEDIHPQGWPAWQEKGRLSLY